MPSWTTEQQKAIDIRDKSLLVAAAAGSGKTKVLVDRLFLYVTQVCCCQESKGKFEYQYYKKGS